MSGTRNRLHRGLSRLRRTVGRNRRLADTLRAIRALVHFGPWRHVARALIRRMRPPRNQVYQPATSYLPPLDLYRVVSSLHDHSVCNIGRISGEIVARIRAETDVLPRGEYALFHAESRAVRALVEDEGLLEVVRSYLGAEPVLLECTVVVQEAEGELRRVSPQRHFHFDYAGWQSLNFFLYLTDVPPDSGAHQVVIGTHTGKRIRDLVRPALDDEEAVRRFGTRIRTIAGPAGTAFFENTEAFHRRLTVFKRRVMLNVLFASHRGLLSHGRLARPYREALRAGAYRLPRRHGTR